MGHDSVIYAGRHVIFRDAMLNLVRCIMVRVANDPQAAIPNRFHERLLSTINEFKFICNGVFTDFKLDDLLQSEQDIEDFLGFVDTCAAFVVSHGPILGQAFLNELVGDSDSWNVDLEINYPLQGLARLAGLVSGAKPSVEGGASG